MGEQKINVVLDDLTLGDLENLESRSFTRILATLDRIVRLEGVPEAEQPKALRALKIGALSDIIAAIGQAVEAGVNPVAEGKN